jgi:lipid-binding SYLF domain-containing protein
MTNAAAPSLIDEEDAAVIVPSFLKAGLSVGIFSGRALPGP